MDTTPLQPDDVPETTVEAQFIAPAATGEDAALGEQELAEAALAPEDEIEDELIIEDFTIDGICGVY